MFCRLGYRRTFETFQGPYKDQNRCVPYICHGFAISRIVHQLEQIILKLCFGRFPLFRVDIYV